MDANMPDSLPKQEGVERYLNYYDIMILGKTGTGKTTTAEKLLIANPTGKDYSYIPPEQGSPTASAEVPDTSTASQDDESVRTNPGKIEPHSKTCQDISMWHLGAPDDLANVCLRLKNLVFCRTLKEPHEEVIKIHKESKSTEKCQLLSNDTSKVRVLDVPGFYGTNSNIVSTTESLPPTTQGTTLDVTKRRSKSTSVHTRTQNTTETDLSIMRKILHIKMAMKFKFNRIVYFLPETGVLIRNSQVLQIEIAIMKHFFERSIFECMVVVATHNCSAYRYFGKDVDLYPPEDIESTKRFFQEALSKVFEGDAIPEPPIIFISLRDSCDEVLRKIRESQVVREGVNLCFNPSTCARCNIKIGELKEKSTKRRGNKEAKEKDEKTIAICTYDSWSAAIPYEESTCHPMLIPKYTTLQRVVGGIAHLITLKAFIGRWPNFENFDEVCINCGSPPKIRGCLRVGTDYIHKKSRESLPVDHTSKVQESFVIELDPDDEPWEDDEETVMIRKKPQVQHTHNAEQSVPRKEQWEAEEASREELRTWSVQYLRVCREFLVLLLLSHAPST